MLLKIFKLSVYFWPCCILVALCGFFSGCGDQGLLFVEVHRLLMVLASLVAEHRVKGARASVVVAHRLSSCDSGLWSTGFIAVAQRPGCSKACGIFLDHGLNSYLLHGQADSLSLSHQGTP